MVLDLHGYKLKRCLIAIIAFAFLASLPISDSLGAVKCLAAVRYSFENSDESGNSGEEIRALTDEMIDRIDLNEWEDYAEKGGALNKNGMGISSVSELIGELTQSGERAEPEGLFEKAVSAFLSQLGRSGSFICLIFAIAVLGGAAGILFKGDGMDTPVKLALSSCAALAAAACFSSLVGAARDACGFVSGFCEICAPPLSILLTACGCTETSAVLMPKLSLLASWIAGLISGTVIPLLLISGILCVLSGISDKLKFMGAVKLSHKTIKWLMGLAAVIYGSVVVIGGSSAAAMDGAVFRSTKYAVDKFLPFGAGIITGTVETVASSALIVKNAVGAGGIIICILLISSPLIKLAAGIFAFRIAAAVCELFSGEAGITKMLGGVADTLGCAFAVCACSGAMLVLTLGIIISAGTTFV